MPKKLILEEKYFEIARENLSMMAMVLTFLGGFALAALMELPQSFQAMVSMSNVGENAGQHQTILQGMFSLHPAFYRFLEHLLVIIAELSLLGALLSVLVYKHASAVQNGVRRIQQRHFEQINMRSLLGAYSLFAFGRVIAELLTYISLGAAVFFLMALVVLSQGMTYQAIILIVGLFGLLFLLLIGREVILTRLMHRQSWQLGQCMLENNGKGTYPVSSLQPVPMSPGADSLHAKPAPPAACSPTTESSISPSAAGSNASKAATGSSASKAATGSNASKAATDSSASPPDSDTSVSKEQHEK